MDTFILIINYCISRSQSSAHFIKKTVVYMYTKNYYIVLNSKFRRLEKDDIFSSIFNFRSKVSKTRLSG